jgi:hypothetical protein
MRVKELDDLAAWFKKNVLDVGHCDDADASDVVSYEEVSKAINGEIDVDPQDELDDELSIIEYIIGVDDIK